MAIEHFPISSLHNNACDLKLSTFSPEASQCFPTSSVAWSTIKCEDTVLQSFLDPSEFPTYPENEYNYCSMRNYHDVVASCRPSSNRFEINNNSYQRWEGDDQTFQVVSKNSEGNELHSQQRNRNEVNNRNNISKRTPSKESTAILKDWLKANKRNPYPSKSEKIKLAITTKMSLTQVSTWFANARRRLKKESNVNRSFKCKSKPHQTQSSEKHSSKNLHGFAGLNNQDSPDKNMELFSLNSVSASKKPKVLKENGMDSMFGSLPDQFALDLHGMSSVLPHPPRPNSYSNYEPCDKVDFFGIYQSNNCSSTECACVNQNDFPSPVRSLQSQERLLEARNPPFCHQSDSTDISFPFLSPDPNPDPNEMHLHWNESMMEEQYCRNLSNSTRYLFSETSERSTKYCNRRATSTSRYQATEKDNTPSNLAHLPQCQYLNQCAYESDVTSSEISLDISPNSTTKVAEHNVVSRQNNVAEILFV